MMRTTLLVVMLFVLATLAGCIDSDNAQIEPADDPAPIEEVGFEPVPEPEPPEPETMRAIDLERQALEEGVISLDQGQGWASLRLRLDEDLVGEDGEIPFAFSYEPQGDAVPYLFLGLTVIPEQGEGPPAFLLPLALPKDRSVVPLHTTVGGSSDNTAELAFIFGSHGGPTEFRLGISDTGSTEALRTELLDRDALPVIPDHRGQQGFVGTYFNITTPNGTVQDIEAGLISVEKQTEIEGPLGLHVGEQLTMSMPDQKLATNGTGSFVSMSAKQAAVQEWSFSLHMGQHEIEDDGIYANVGGITPPVLTSIDQFDSMDLLGQARTETGDFSMQATRDASGKNGLTGVAEVDESLDMASGTAVTIGWFSGDLEAMYGWTWQDIWPEH